MTTEIALSPQKERPVSTKRVPILAIGGMWEDSRQWQKLEKPFENEGLELHTWDHPGHGLRSYEGLGHVSTALVVKDKIAYLHELETPSILLCHSYGVIIGLLIAELRPDLVAGILACASAPHKGCSIPFKLMFKLLKPCYWPAMLLKRPFKLTETDRIFVRDSRQSAFQLGNESGIILREVLLGIPVPPMMSSLIKCPCRLLIPTDDEVIPFRIASEIADYHGIEPFFIKGGHFAHLRDENEEVIKRHLSELKA